MRKLASAFLLGIALFVPHLALAAETRVLASTFPMYLFTREVTRGAPGIHVDIMLPSEAGCPHDYALTTSDMEKIAHSNILVMNGLGLEEFLGAPLRSANPGIVVIDSSVGIENLIPMTPEHGTGEHHPHAQAEHLMNPHLFAGPTTAAAVVRSIAEGLSSAIPASAAIFRENASGLSTQLQKLTERCRQTGTRLRNRKVVTQHAIFDYLSRDVGLEIVAVVEEDPGVEPAASEMLRLTSVIRNSGVGAVFAEPQYSDKVARTLAREAHVAFATLDPVASGPIDAPPDYYEKTMLNNLEVLERTLNSAGH